MKPFIFVVCASQSIAEDCVKKLKRFHLVFSFLPTRPGMNRSLCVFVFLMCSKQCLYFTLSTGELKHEWQLEHQTLLFPKDMWTCVLVIPSLWGDAQSFVFSFNPSQHACSHSHYSCQHLSSSKIQRGLFVVYAQYRQWGHLSSNQGRQATKVILSTDTQGQTKGLNTYIDKIFK